MLKWLKLLAAVAVVTAACLVFVWWIGSPRLVEYARERIVREVGNALDEPVTLESLSVSLLPPRVNASGFAVGASGEVIRADELSVRILPWSSLKQLRPVGEAKITGLLVDVSRLTDESEDQEADDEDDGGERAIPFRIRDLDLERARVIIPAGDVPFELTTDRLVASGGLSPISRRFSLRADGDLTVRRGADALHLSQLHLVGAEGRDGLVVQELAVSGDAIELTASLDGRDPPRHTVSAKLELALLSLIDDELAPFSGAAEIAGTLDGSLENPGVAADVRIEDLTVSDRRLGNLTGRFSREENVLRATSTRLEGFGGSVEAQAQLTLSGEQPGRFAVEWRELDVDALAKVIGEELSMALSTSGSAEGSATLEPLTVAARGQGQLATGKAAPLEWSLDGRYDVDGTSRLTLDGGQGQLNSLHAVVNVAPDESLSGDVRLDLGDVSLLAGLAGREELPFAGRLRASAAFSGSLEAPAVGGKVDGANLVVFGEPIGTMQGDLFVDNQHARSSRLAIDFGDGQVVVAGTLGFDSKVRNDWRASIRDVRIDRVVGLVRAVAGTAVPLSQGRLSATVEGYGPWTQVDAKGFLDARSFELAGEPFDRLRVDGKTSWPVWEVDAAVVHAGDEKLDATIRGRGADEILNANVESAWWSLQHLQIGDSTDVGGEVRMSGAVRGRIESLDGEVKLEARELMWSEHEVGEVTIDGEAIAGRWQLSTRLMDGAVTLVGGVDSKTGAFRVELDWDEANLTPLLGERPGVEISSSGELQLAGDVQDLRSVGGNAQIPQLLIRSGSLQLAAQQPIALGIDNGRVAIESCILAGDGTRLQVSGGLTLEGELSLSGEGSGSMELLELMGEPLQSVEGTFAVKVNADRRQGGDLELTGTVSVADAAMDVGLPIGVTETNGSFVLNESVVRVETLEGQLGGGTFTLSGSVDIQQGPDLSWRVADVSGSLVPSLEQELSGQGTMQGEWTDLTVAGEIEILRLLYDRNIEPRDFIPSFKRRLAPAEGRPSGNVVRLDLRIHAPDDLHIDNNFARVEAMADLRLRGTTVNPNLRGRIDVLAGEVFFRDRTFDVVTGVVDFRPQLDLVADLNITAETIVETAETTYGVTVRISGTTDDPKVVLSADDPGLTQTDVLALITFGKTVAQLQQGSGGSSMEALIGFVTGRVAKGVESEAESFLRVDRVEIEPAFSSNSGAFEPQVKISKDFGDDLTASIATTLGVDLQRAMNLEYRLTDRTSLLGTWESESEGQAGAVGGGVKFRRDFRSVWGFSLLGK